MKAEHRELPLSPPLSPMTNHLARIDEWRRQIEYEDPVDSAHESNNPSADPRSFARPTSGPSQVLPSFYERPYSHHNQWSVQRTTSYANIAPAERPTAPEYPPPASIGLPRMIDQVSVPLTKAADRNELHIEDEDIELSDLEPDDDPENPSVTVAELRAHNRRLKRFRLTHSQTRYLMSEFARQPRPDAAHRERLSREIPGFSGRQVQVWFQNRRAKLKRLTNDDRERVLRSRALPANFDMTQALQSPFTVSKPGFQTPIQPSVSTGEPSGWGRLALDTQRHTTLPGYYTRYHDRASYSSPPDPIAPKTHEPVSYLATPASLSSKAQSPKYVARPFDESRAGAGSPYSLRNASSSFLTNQPSRNHSIDAGYGTNSVPDFANFQRPRINHPNLHSGSTPTPFQPERLPQRWPVTAPHSTASSLSYDRAVQYPPSQEQWWNAPSQFDVSRSNVNSGSRWYDLQERETTLSGGGYESINFEPLYRQQQRFGRAVEPSLQPLDQTPWKEGHGKAVAPAPSMPSQVFHEFKPFPPP